MAGPSAVSRDLTASVNGEQMCVVATCAALDPFAARLTFYDGGPPHSWYIAVDVLLAGLRRAVGVGDVRVRPEGDEVLLHLNPGAQDAATVRFLRCQFAGFVRAAARVPRDGFGAVIDNCIAALQTSPLTVDDAAKDAAILRIWDSLGDEEADR